MNRRCAKVIGQFAPDRESIFEKGGRFCIIARRNSRQGKIV